MSFNTKQTACLIVKPFDRKYHFKVDFPLFTACDQTLSFVSLFEYLGHILTDDQSANLDIRRAIKSPFTPCNILISRFKKCSYNDAKIVLLSETRKRFRLMLLSMPAAAVTNRFLEISRKLLDLATSKFTTRLPSTVFTFRPEMTS